MGLKDVSGLKGHSVTRILIPICWFIGKISISAPSGEPV